MDKLIVVLLIMLYKLDFKHRKYLKYIVLIKDLVEIEDQVWIEILLIKTNKLINFHIKINLLFINLVVKVEHRNYPNNWQTSMRNSVSMLKVELLPIILRQYWNKKKTIMDILLVNMTMVLRVVWQLVTLELILTKIIWIDMADLMMMIMVVI